MADLKVIQAENNKVVFSVSKTSPGYVNAIRRNIMSDVPTLAIDSVEFRKNNSGLYDEILAHRLGLLPLKTDLKTYVKKSECKCNGEGCAKCSVKLILKQKGPKTVYASDMKPTDPSIVPIYPNTPLLILLKDQEVEFEATAILGTGKEHVKWSPGHTYFKITPSIKVDSQKVENPELIVEMCPHDIFEMKSNKLAVVEKNLINCNLCHACTDASAGIQLEETEEDYIFYLESWGQLSPQEIMVSAVEIFTDKLKQFEKLL